MAKEIFYFNSYKKFLLHYIEEHSGRGIVGHLAKAAGCNRTYFSQVMHAKAQLLPDHVPGLARALSLTEPEERYFLYLVLWERAGTESAQSYFKEKMIRISEQHANLTAKAKDSSVVVEFDEQFALYFGDSIYQAIHLMTAFPGGQTVSSLAKVAGLSPTKIQKILSYLLDLGLVRKSGAVFFHSGQNVHMAREGVWNKLNHLNWRMKAVEDSSNPKSLHFSSVFAIARADYAHLQRLVHEFLEEYQKFAKASGSEELVILCCDLFQPFSDSHE